MFTNKVTRIISLKEGQIRHCCRSGFKLGLVLIAFVALGLGATSPAALRFSEWSEPVNLGPIVNSSSNDRHPAISKNGLSLYFTSDRPGGFGGLDIWVSHRATLDDPWGPPQNVGPNINTSGDENAPNLSVDGHSLYFGSTRPGGFGRADIWVSRRHNKRDDFGWEPPVNLGLGINTAAEENGPTIFEDDETGITTLYFTSLNRPGGMGDWDVYASTLNPDGSFGPAVLVSELSSSARDTRTAIRRDGLEMFISSNRPGSFGDIDLWVSTRVTTGDAWSTPVNLGLMVNSAFDDGAPALSWNGKTLFFYSNRPGGFGGRDLYMIKRKKLRGSQE